MNSLIFPWQSAVTKCCLNYDTIVNTVNNAIFDTNTIEKPFVAVVGWIVSVAWVSWVAGEHWLAWLAWWLLKVVWASGLTKRENCCSTSSKHLLLIRDWSGCTGQLSLMTYEYFTAENRKVNLTEDIPPLRMILSNYTSPLFMCVVVVLKAWTPRAKSSLWRNLQT